MELLIFLAIIVLARSETNTTDDYCFPSNYGFNSEFNKEIVWTPISPNKMNVKFLLFTCKNKDTPQNFSYLSEIEEWTNSNLDVNKTTRYIVHGWTETYPGNPGSGYKWMELMKNQILSKSCDNVIAVDWSLPANSSIYFPSAANCIPVGKMIGCVVNRLKTLGLSPERVHLIGHSLGGEVVAFAGKEVTNPKIRQITGLDPASPGFQEFPDSHKLAVTDGQCVNVIHTNGALVPIIDGLGNIKPMGHADFYPNGGHFQPGCLNEVKKDLEEKAPFNKTKSDLKKVGSCSHHWSNSYALADQNYTDSKKCQLIGHTCSSYIDFVLGKCGPCGTDGKGCKPMPFNMEYWDDPNNCDSNAEHVEYFLNTGDVQDPPGYCLHHYQIIASIKNQIIQCLGEITIKLSNGRQIDLTLNFINQLKTIKGNKRFTKLYTNREELGEFKGGELTSSIECVVNKIEFNYMSSLDASVRKAKSFAICPTKGQSFSKC